MKLSSLFQNKLVLELRAELAEQKQLVETIRLAAIGNNHEICSMWQARIDDLKQQVAGLEKERDYFKGRAERLELRLLPDPTVMRPRPVSEVPFAPGRPAGSWAQVQTEHAAKEREAQEQAKREREAIDAPAPIDQEQPATVPRPKRSRKTGGTTHVPS